MRVTFGPHDTLFSVAGLLFILGGLGSIPLLRTAPGGEQAQPPRPRDRDAIDEAEAGNLRLRSQRR